MSDHVLSFSIPRDVLAAGVDRVSKAVQKRNTIPQLAHVLMRAENGGVTLRGTDLDVDAVVRVEGAAICVPGGLTVPAAEFSALLARWIDGPLTIESDGRRMFARLSKSKASLPVLLEADFPDIKAGEPECTFEIPGSDLTAMAEHCGFAMGTEETRNYLMGIYLHADDRADKLRAVATDGHRLSRFDMPLPEGAETMRGVIIPGKTIRLWSQLLGKDESEPITVEVSESFIRFRSDLMTLHSKVVYGTYPDYERVIPRGNNQVAFVNLTDLAQAVDRLLVFREGKAPKSHLTFSSGALMMTIRSETGEAEEGLAAECDFDLEIGFNPKYLRDMLATMTGPRIRLAMSDPGSPPLITDEGDPRRELVLMPMRV